MLRVGRKKTIIGIAIFITPVIIGSFLVLYVFPKPKSKLGNKKNIGIDTLATQILVEQT